MKNAFAKSIMWIFRHFSSILFTCFFMWHYLHENYYYAGWSFALAVIFSLWDIDRNIRRKPSRPYTVKNYRWMVKQRMKCLTMAYKDCEEMRMNQIGSKPISEMVVSHAENYSKYIFQKTPIDKPTVETTTE